MRIVFQERAESVSFPVALASCLAKYARETWMEGFNAYFASLQSGLLPTAGYVTDARRWLEEAGPALALCGLDRTALVRER
jgi:ribonuclease HII